MSRERRFHGGEGLAFVRWEGGRIRIDIRRGVLMSCGDILWGMPSGMAADQGERMAGVLS